MAQMPAAGKKQNNIRLRIGTDNYEKQVSSVEFAPQKGQEWQGGTPDAKLVDIDWLCNITAVQAWDDATSYVRWSLEHAGEQAEVEYQPHAEDATFKLYATITVMPPTIGGKVNQRNESTVACPSTEPTTTAPGA